MTLTKADIVAEVYAQGLLTKAEAADAVERSLDLIKEALAAGEEVLVSGFGKWSVRAKTERRGRNPQTGDPLTLPPRRVVTFRPSRVLKARVQGEEFEPLPEGEEKAEKKPAANGNDKSRILRPGYF
ncbi:MAG: integration host factor subunit alpha [Pseudomonadota bacterium]